MDQLSLVAGLPVIEVISGASWERLLIMGRRKATLKCQGIITLAWRAACLMQAEMIEESSFDTFVLPCLNDADVDDLLSTKFVLEAVIRILSVHWVHGTQLQNWHNRRNGMPGYTSVIMTNMN